MRRTSGQGRTKGPGTAGPQRHIYLSTLGDRVYPTLAAKQEALEPILKAWQADPERVRQLCGWRWIREALTDLPADTVMP